MFSRTSVARQNCRVVSLFPAYRKSGISFGSVHKDKLRIHSISHVRAT